MVPLVNRANELLRPHALRVFQSPLRARMIGDAGRQADHAGALDVLTAEARRLRTPDAPSLSRVYPPAAEALFFDMLAARAARAVRRPRPFRRATR